MGVAIAVLCIALGGVAAQWMAWRLRLPAIVLLFAAGLLFGPGLQVLHPVRQFGPSLRPIIGLAVAIVVFEGGLALDMRELRAAGQGILRLTTLAVAATLVLGTIAAHEISRMGWGAASLYGAIVVVTGPTVVLPLLRQTRLQPRVASLLKWEAILNDPVGAVLAALVLAVLLAPFEANHASAVARVGRLVGGLLAAVLLGTGAGLLVHRLSTRDLVPELLKTPLLLALTMSVYAVANLATPEAGLISATLFGVTLANLRLPGLAELKRSQESLVVLIVSALFIVLTAELDRPVLVHVSWPVVGLAAAMLFVVRPAAILLATLGAGLPLPERLVVGWIAPRGVVAAAVAGAAGNALNGGGYPGALLVMPAVFALIGISMVLHGFSLRPLARAFNLTLGSAPGLAIIGACDWSTAMAATLHESGVPVLLIDTFPGALDPARDAGIPVLQAEILSEHGEEELAGKRVDYVFAATADDVYNGLVCAHLAPEIGRERVLQLPPESRRPHHRTGISREARGKVIGVPPIDFETFERRFGSGWHFALIEAGAAPPAESPWVELLAVHANGTLAFASVESPDPSVRGSGERMLVFAAPEAAHPPQPAPEALESSQP